MKIEFKTYFDEGCFPLHRLQLVRGSPERVICFLMLNPSMADDKTDDPTIKRCKGFMTDLGYTGLIVVNLFTVISKDPDKIYKALRKDCAIWPKRLKAQPNKPNLKSSANHIKYAFKISEIIVAGYGALKHKNAIKRAEEIFKMTKKPIYALKLTKSGFPGHPLYLNKNRHLTLFRRAGSGHKIA